MAGAENLIKRRKAKQKILGKNKTEHLEHLDRKKQHQNEIIIHVIIQEFTNKNQTSSGFAVEFNLKQDKDEDTNQYKDKDQGLEKYKRYNREIKNRKPDESYNRFRWRCIREAHYICGRIQMCSVTSRVKFKMTVPTKYIRDVLIRNIKTWVRTNFITKFGNSVSDADILKDIYSARRGTRITYNI